MKLVLAVIFALFIFGMGISFGDKGTYFDKVKFIQYSDDNTAVEEVKNGHLDIYYSAVPSDRLDEQTRKNLNVYQSTGSSFSLLVNPAPSEEFNPFSIREVRFALNYLVDRNLIVDEILSGNGASMVSAYKPYDPDYLLILNDLQSFNFKYNPTLANKIISSELENSGAQKIGEKWYYKSKPITITIFIRSDDPIRKSIGEILSSQLQEIGFTVKKDYGDLTKAFSIVYGSNPIDLKWSIYTEGYTMSAFVRYDSVTTAQLYSPWFSNMPGFSNPTYWNYQNSSLDSLSQAIYLGNFTSSEERASLIRKAVDMGIQESVRVFLAVKKDQFIANKKVDGIINDFGAGITSRFTPINARSDSDTLTIGVKTIYQGAWNPIGGFTDTSSREIWEILGDSGSFKNPYTGLTIPVRSDWKVEAPGPMGKVDVPSDAIRWNATQQKWTHVGSGLTATSKVTFNLKFGNWHNKIPMDMNDILYGIYFSYQWGQDQSVKTFDSEFSPKANQAIKTLVGVRVIDKDTIEVYQNYWHIDEGEIADSAQVWTAVPWEIMYSMEKAVTDGKLAFSRSDAVSKNISWLSLIIPDDAKIIKSNLEDFANTTSIPNALSFVNDSNYFKSRYQASISWINKHNHAVISNGPYYLDSYSPEARTITIQSFDDPTYPLPAGHWKNFEEISLPKIENINVPSVVSIGKELDVPISVTPNATVYYYFINSQGKIIDQGNQSSDTGVMKITLSSEKSMNLDLGSNDLQAFVISDVAYKPDIFSTSFLAIKGQYQAPTESTVSNFESTQVNYGYLVGFIILAIGIGVVFAYKRVRANHLVRQ